VILGNPARPAIWRWDGWKEVAPLLDGCIGSARGRAIVRSTQFEATGKKSISFGKIGWNDEGHQKWTHGSPMTAGAPETWRFLDMEVWAPGRRESERDGQPPDLLFTFRNEAFWHRAEGPKFNPTILLASGSDCGLGLREQAKQAVVALAARLNAVLAAHQQRPWAKRFGEHLFTDSIGDMLTTGLFKVGDPHKRAVDLGTLTEEWSDLSR